MIPPVVIEFLVKGLPEVSKALKSIQDTVTQTETKSVAATRLGKNARQKILEQEAREKIAAMKRVDRMVDAANRAGVSGAEKRFKAESKSAQAAAKEKVNAYKKMDSEADKAFNNEKKRLSKLESDYKKSIEQKAKDQVAAIKKTDAEAQKAFDASKRRQETAEKTKANRAESRLNTAREQAMFDRRRAVSIPEKLEAQKRINLLKEGEGKSPEFQNRLVKEARLMKIDAELEKKKQDAVNKEVKKGDDERRRLEEAAEKRRIRMQNRSATEMGNIAKKAAKEEAAKKERFGKTVYGMGSSAVAGATTVAGGVIRGALDVGGGFSLTDSLQQDIQDRGLAAKIAASSTGQHSAAEIYATAKAQSIEGGFDVNETLRGYDEIKKLAGGKNGEGLNTAKRIMPRMQQLALATGSDLGELSGLAANILAVNEDGDKNISDDALMQQMRVFTQQGMVGGVEVADFAKYGNRVMAGAALHGGDLQMNATIGGASAQIARQKGGAASAAEATLASQRFSTDVQKKAGSLEEMGIKISDGAGKMRSQEDIIVDMLNNESDVTKISKFKLGERGNRVLTGAADIYRSAGGGAAGERAVRAEFAKYKNAMKEAEVEQRAKQRMAETDLQLKKAMVQLKTTVAQSLLPALQKFIPVLVRAVPIIGKMLDAFVKLAQMDPLGGLGILLAGSIGKEVAGAGLKAILEKSLATSLGGSAGLVLGTAVISIAAATMAIQALDKQQDEHVQGGVAAGANATNALSLLKHGGIQTKEQLDEAKAAAAGLQKQLPEEEKNAGGSKIYYGAALVGAGIRDMAALLDLSGNAKGGNIKEVEAARQKQIELDNKNAAEHRAQLQQLNTAIAEATKRLGELGKTAGAVPAAGQNTAAAKPAPGPVGRPNGK